MNSKLKYEMEEAKKARIKDLTVKEYKDLIFIIAKYNQMDINGNTRYYYRVLNKDYLNITRLFKLTQTFTRTYKSHASTNNPNNLIDIDFLEFIYNQAIYHEII